MLFEILLISATLLLAILMVLLLALANTVKSERIRRGYQSRRDVKKIKEQIVEDD